MKDEKHDTLWEIKTQSKNVNKTNLRGRHLVKGRGNDLPESNRGSGILVFHFKGK